MTIGADRSAMTHPVGPPPLSRRRICLLSEDLAGTPDEGVKNTALSLATALRRRHDVLILSTEGAAPLPGARLAPASRTFLSVSLRANLREHRPEALLYVARSSTTFSAFLRTRLLRAYWPRATVALIGLQARQLGAAQRWLIRWLRPDRVIVQSVTSQRYLERLGCSVEVIASGIDLQRFRPVDADRRRELRGVYGLRTDCPVVLHVGHLRRGRGVQLLGELAARDDWQVVLVASPSTDPESALANALRRQGVIVLDHFVPQVEHFYQLADCYVFPVQSTDHSIEVPLSVLEALACNLQVVTTRFGGLPAFFQCADSPALTFVDSPEQVVSVVDQLTRVPVRGGRALVEPYSWDVVAETLLARILPEAASGA